MLLPDVACASCFLIHCPCKNTLHSVVWLGVINIPAVALGMFSGGVVIKKYKLGILGAAKFAFGTSLLGYFLSLFFLAMGCENSKVAGITVSYTGYVMAERAVNQKKALGLYLGKIYKYSLLLTHFLWFLLCCFSVPLFHIPCTVMVMTA